MSPKEFSANSCIYLLLMLLISNKVFCLAKTPPKSPPPNAETAHWRTFRSEKYGFVAKYPPGFNISQDPAGYIIFGAPQADSRFGLSISSLRQSGKLSLLEFVHNDTGYEQDYSYIYTRGSRVCRNGVTIYRFERILGSSTRQGSFFLKGRNEGTMADYLIEYDPCNGGACGHGQYTASRFVKNPYTKQYEQILSTFRFIEPASTEGDQ